MGALSVSPSPHPKCAFPRGESRGRRKGTSAQTQEVLTPKVGGGDCISTRFTRAALVSLFRQNHSSVVLLQKPEDSTSASEFTSCISPFFKKRKKNNVERKKEHYFCSSPLRRRKNVANPLFPSDDFSIENEIKTRRTILITSLVLVGSSIRLGLLVSVANYVALFLTR